MKSEEEEDSRTQRVEQLLKRTEGRRVSVLPAEAPEGADDAESPGGIKNVVQLLQ